jgi:hypothetical protein
VPSNNSDEATGTVVAAAFTTLVPAAAGPDMGAHRATLNLRLFNSVNTAHFKGELRCTLFNARSIKTEDKLLHLHAVLHSKEFDTVLNTETWLNNNIPAGLSYPENHFNIITCNRKSGQVGGV